mgnify:CR=1 FL=1
MRRIKIKNTGEVKTVTNNIAFDLIDSGKAELVGVVREDFKNYGNRQMSSTQKGRPSGQAPYKVK